MAIFDNDFISRILGGQPSSGQPVNGQSTSAASIAMPTLQNAQSQDYQNAMMNRMGQLGMLLVAAGQRMTPKERATIIAQAPQYMGGIQGDVMNAAQARLMAARAQQEQTEQARQATVDAKLSDPAYLAGLGIKPEVADAIGSDGIKKLIVNQAMANTPDAMLDRQYKQAQINHLNNPPKGSDPYTDTLSRERAQFDARKAQADALGLKGEDAQQYAATGKMQTANEKQTQDQANAALFSSRMDTSNKIISDPSIYQYGMGVKGVMNRSNDAIPLIGHAFTDPQYQQFDQAQRDFVNAALRRESGSAISSGEFENARKQYFPQIGDSPEVLKQKEANRQLAIKGIFEAAAPQYRRTHPLDGSAPEASGGASPFKEYPDARQAPDGHWYVKQNGKTYKVDR